MSDTYRDYAQLLAQFLDGSLAASQFRNVFQSRFQSELRELDDELARLLDRVFADVEVFSEDAEVIASRPGMYIDEAELRRCIARAAEELRAISSRANY